MDTQGKGPQTSESMRSSGFWDVSVELPLLAIGLLLILVLALFPMLLEEMVDQGLED